MGHQVKDVTLRLQALNGVWETAGADRGRGLWVEDVSLSADQWGSSSASCTLHRDARNAWPDIGAFTPVEFEVGGMIVWSGRIQQTPAHSGMDRVMNLQCEGWQFHLDDDLYDKSYIFTDLSKFVDLRQIFTIPLITHPTQYEVISDTGGITIAAPNGIPINTGQTVGVIVDLGYGNGAKHVSALVQSSFISGNHAFYIIGSNTPYWADQAAGREDYVSSITNNNAVFGSNGAVPPTRLSGTTTNAHRYITLLMYNLGSGAVTNGADVWFRVSDIKIFAESTYQAGLAHDSILFGSDVVKDALNVTCPLLSTDLSQIQTSSSFAIPHLAPGDNLTTREWINAANAWYDWTTKVDVEKRVVFAPKAAVAATEVGQWAALEDDDASANSGLEIYSRVLVQATSPDGQPVRVERLQALQAGVEQTVIGNSTAFPVANPSFDVNTAGWSAGVGTLSRDTTTFDSSPASGKMIGVAGAGGAYGDAFIANAWGGSFVKGQIYIVQVALRANDVSDYFIVSVSFGDPNTVTTTFIPVDQAWHTYQFPITCSTAGAGSLIVSAEVRLPTGAAPTMWIDSLVLLGPRPTLVDKRGFRRTKILQVSAPLPTDGVAAAQLGDVWLKEHKTTPFKGSGTIGSGGVRHILTGQTVQNERLLLRTNELIRFSDRADPDTGAWGRDGRIASVTYTPATDEVELTVDNSRSALDTLLARLGVVTSSSG